jgi:hypothetical protein
LKALLKGCHRPKTVLAFNAMGASILLIVALQAVAPAAQLPTGGVLRVSGAVSQPLALSLQDLAAMPRTKVTAKEHDKTITFEGVSLAQILQKAGTMDSDGGRHRGGHAALSRILHEGHK